MADPGSLFWALLAVAHVALALSISLHVLFNKRDVGASMAWMGLAWLSPFLGALIYVSFGINRVERRALRLRKRRPSAHTRTALEAVADRADHLAPLERAVRQLTGRRVESGNSIVMLANGDQAYPRMLAAIDAAAKSVALSSYIFRDDRAGGAFIDALARACGRGVAVCVLIDGLGGGYLFSPAYRRLRQAEVPASRFLHSWLPWRMSFLNLRSHKKLLCVDGRIAFTGGLNIGDENVLEEQPPEPVRDIHFQVEGPLVSQLTETFVEDWLFITGERLSGAAWLGAAGHAGDAIGRAITSGPDHDLEKIELAILQAISCARQSIKILTPYFLPDSRLSTALTLAAMRGISVEIVVPERSDLALADWARHALIRPLVVAGCRIWNSPPPFDHSKLLAVDGAWSLIGSANWDARSLRLNFELNVEVYQPELAQQIEAVITGKRGAAVTLGEIDGRPRLLRLRDHCARLMLPYL